MPTINCSFCGNRFYHKSSMVKYCSLECRKRGISLSNAQRSASFYHKTKVKDLNKSNHNLGTNPGFPRKNLTDSGTKALALYVLRSAIKEQDVFFVNSSWCEFWCDLARIDVGYFRERFPLLIDSDSSSMFVERSGDGKRKT